MLFLVLVLLTVLILAASSTWLRRGPDRPLRVIDPAWDLPELYGQLRVGLP